MWIQCPDCGGSFKVSFLWEFFSFIGCAVVIIGVLLLLVWIWYVFSGKKQEAEMAEKDDEYVRKNRPDLFPWWWHKY